MTLLSITYSALGTLLIFVLLKNWLEEQHALIITFLIAFNPMVWFYGVTPEVYSIDLFFSVLVVLLGLKSKTIYMLPIILALLSGLRQSSGILIIPLYIFLWIREFRSGEISVPKFITSHILGLLIGLVWFLLMLQTTGGIKEYFELYKTNNPIPKISLFQNIYQFSSYCFYVFAPIIFILLSIPLKKKSLNVVFESEVRDLLLILALWFIPSFLVFTFFHYSKGYFLISIIPFYVLTGFLLKKNIIKEWICWIMIVLQILFFIFIPYRESSVESTLSPDKRKQNLFETWKDRTFSSYLMAYSRIKYQDDLIEGLSNIVEKNKSKIIFLDPTIYLSARGMQLKFPGVTFVTMDFYKSNSYHEYKGLDITPKNDMDKVMKNSLLITRKDFYDYYLRDIAKNGSVESNYVSLLIEENNKNVLMNKYQNLFMR